MSELRAFELFMSAITLLASWLVGSKSTQGMRLNMVAIILWWVYIPIAGAWGLIPMQIGFAIIGTRNLLKWAREAEAEKRRNWASPGVEAFYKEQGRGR